MKKLIKLFLFVILTAFLAMSCTTYSHYYQVAKVDIADNKTKNIDGNIVFSDENISILYYFWSINGNVCFTIENKTNKDITIHLDESFFIHNDIAFDYFQNRYYMSEKNINQSVKTINNSLYSVNQTSIQNSESTIVKEKEKIVIPPNTKRIINEFIVLTERYRSCDLLCDYLGSDGLDSISFTQENTPFAFENKIIYSIEDTRKTVSNKFYISNITNFTDEAFIKTQYKKQCPNDSEYDEVEVTEYLQYAPNKCYITYTPGNEKH